MRPDGLPVESVPPFGAINRHYDRAAVPLHVNCHGPPFCVLGLPVPYWLARCDSRARVRAREAARSAPTGNGAAHTSVAPASKKAAICAVTASSLPTITASAGELIWPRARIRW